MVRGAAHAATPAVLAVVAGTPAQGAYGTAEMRHDRWRRYAPSQLHRNGAASSSTPRDCPGPSPP
jgi:hypothetical protein